MTFNPENLLEVNLSHGGKGFRNEFNKNSLIEKISVINAIQDPFERVAYLALVLIADQPFKDGNHRTTAAAVSNELGNQTNRTAEEIETWLRTAHDWHEDKLGMDIQMLKENDLEEVTQARKAFIEYLGG